MTEAMPFLQNYDITFLRPPVICGGVEVFMDETRGRLQLYRIRNVCGESKIFYSTTDKWDKHKKQGDNAP